MSRLLAYVLRVGQEYTWAAHNVPRPTRLGAKSRLTDKGCSIRNVPNNGGIYGLLRVGPYVWNSEFTKLIIPK